MNRRLPPKVQDHFTVKIRTKARELLGDEKYDTYFNACEPDHYRVFVCDVNRGRTSYTTHNITIPHWAMITPSVAKAVIKLGYKGPLLNQYWIYYLAHELAHAISHEEFGEKNHGTVFMKTFISICPAELQFFELGYKPKHAKAAGISR